MIGINRRYGRDLYMQHLTLSHDQRDKARFISSNPFADFSTLESYEIVDLGIYWAYYSAKIESNTYTYVETECLLKDGITSLKTYTEATMLKNLYNTFIDCVECIKKGGELRLNPCTVMELHAMLTNDLLPLSQRGTLRSHEVRITGSDYIPPSDPILIKQKLTDILIEQEKYDDPFARSIFLHCNIARLQPFSDGNKRTSRLVESIVLMSAHIIPVRSNRQADILRYRSAIAHFYETEDYNPYIDFALDMQIQRINEVASPKFRWR